MISEQIVKRIHAGDVLEVNKNCTGVLGTDTIWEDQQVIATEDEFVSDGMRLVTVAECNGMLIEDMFSVFAFNKIEVPEYVDTEAVQVESTTLAKQEIADAAAKKLFTVKYYIVEQNEEEVVADTEEEAIRKIKGFLVKLRDKPEEVVPLRDTREQKVIAALNNIITAEPYDDSTYKPVT